MDVYTIGYGLALVRVLRQSRHTLSLGVTYITFKQVKVFAHEIAIKAAWKFNAVLFGAFKVSANPAYLANKRAAVRVDFGLPAC